MHDGQTMNYDELQQAAAQAIDDAGTSQAQVARELDVTRGAVSRAVKEPGSALFNLQSRIIAHLTDYRVEREVETKIHVRKAER